MQRGQPVAVNWLQPTHASSMTAPSFWKHFLNDISNYGKTVFVVGTGNEGAGDGRNAGQLVMNQPQEVELTVGAYQTSFSVQLWKSYTDIFDISLITPSGETIGPVSGRLGPQTIRL